MHRRISTLVRKKMKKEIYCTLQIQGTHNWPDCPFDDVGFLRENHRHVFHIKAYKFVTHNNRDVEFIRLKNKILKYLNDKYEIPVGNKQGDTFIHEYKIHAFGSKSCEMIGEELIQQFDLSKCDVSEDNENGSVVYAC